MRTMEKAEWLEWVHRGVRTGKLATNRADGFPRVVPIWFLVDDDRLIFGTHAETAKSKALRRDPRFAVCVDSDTEPHTFVQFQAEATISEDLDEIAHWGTQIAKRYIGEEYAEEFGKGKAVPGELLVYGKISKVIAIADIDA